MHSVFRLVMLALVVGYSLPRVYYRRRARHARMKEESTRPPVTESKWRLALMGISGGGANLVGLAWPQVAASSPRGLLIRPVTAEDRPPQAS